jgi:predicted RNA-binding Zn-ribbon protein involved in translation (DUF1610 family)
MRGSLCFLLIHSLICIVQKLANDVTMGVELGLGWFFERCRCIVSATKMRSVDGSALRLLVEVLIVDLLDIDMRIFLEADEDDASDVCTYVCTYIHVLRAYVHTRGVWEIIGSSLASAVSISRQLLTARRVSLRCPDCGEAQSTILQKPLVRTRTLLPYKSL